MCMRRSGNIGGIWICLGRSEGMVTRVRVERTTFSLGRNCSIQ